MTVDLAFDTDGDGPPIVLTHGLGDSAATWDAICPALRGRSSVTRWDLRGHGRSGTPSDPTEYSPEIAVTDLLRIIDRCEAPVTLVGHSLGGYLSLSVALRHPELVCSLAMIASGPGFSDPAARAAWNDYIDDVAPQMPIASGSARLAHQLDSIVIDTLGSLRCPLTQIVGEHDRRFHAGVGFIRRTLPDCTTHVIAGAGHHPQRSHPDAVLDALELAVLDA